MLSAWEEQIQYVPNGTGTLSKMPSRYPANYPKFLLKGKGGTVLDNDFKEYVDLIAGLGAISVGYSNQWVNEAVRDQLALGSVFSLPSRLEYKMAKKLTELIPGTEMWKFGLNGTDANVMAVRAARAYTGRTKIITVGYNGCADVFECQGTRNKGIPISLKEHNIRARYNDKVSFITGEIPAAILLEPMMFDSPAPGFLEWIRDQCTQFGIILIFDEVVNGGRFEEFTSAAYFGVRPDLYTIGKGIANGFPLSAVGGARRIMQTFEWSDFFASGTFSTPAISLAAGLATVQILQNSNSSLIEKGLTLQKAFNQLFSDKDVKAVGYPTRLDFRFPTKEHKFLFWQEMCTRGVLVGYTNFVMVDHTDRDIKHIIYAMEDSAKILKANWHNPKAALDGDMPEEALLRRNN